jgi:hypothetical protein
LLPLGKDAVVVCVVASIVVVLIVSVILTVSVSVGVSVMVSVIEIVSVVVVVSSKVVVTTSLLQAYGMARLKTATGNNISFLFIGLTSCLSPI